MSVPKRLLAAMWLLLAIPATVARGQPPAGPAIDPRIAKLVASISEERLQQLLQKLSSFKTRNTCSVRPRRTRSAPRVSGFTTN
jgi:hypothetical protein